MNIDILRRIDPDLYLFSFDCQHFNFNIFTDLDSFVTLPCQNKHYPSPFSLWVATVAIGALIGNASSFSMYCLPIFVRELMITGACKLDRKSTRLNSSHVSTSYAVFCLKKKTAHERCSPTWHGKPRPPPPPGRDGSPRE